MKILKKLENIFSSVAFAEAGEFDTARQILKENETESKPKHREAESRSAGDSGHASHSPSRA